MAENKSTSSATTNTFSKGLVKDYNDSFVGEGFWTHARNAVNNSHDGQLGVIGNEPSNLKCIDVPYTYIGHIHLRNDMWAIFSTDDLNSEIGLFVEGTCSYTKIVNSKCLNFKKTNLITGASKRNFDSTTSIYWDDALNPSRYMNIDYPPFQCVKVAVDATDEYKKYNTVDDSGDIYAGCTYVKIYAGECGDNVTYVNYIDCFGDAVAETLEPGDTTEFWVNSTDSIIVNFNCTTGLVSDPVMVILSVKDPNPLIQKTLPKHTCYKLICSRDLDCERLRLAKLVTNPCLKLSKGLSAGTLPNGSYQITAAYTVNQIRVTDFFTPSNVVSIFSHDNLNGSIDITIDSMDSTNYDEFELVIVSTVNQQTVARRLGNYSTSQNKITIGTIDPTLPVVPLNILALRNLAIDKSDAMYEVNDYLLRVGIYSKPELNYQLQANGIKTKWQAVQYPADYYKNIGENVSYLRDEVYSFFIRWVYNTGEKSASFHIPGREALPYDLQINSSVDAIESKDGILPKRWMVENTATVTAVPNTVLSDGGVLLAEGLMAYWESTEQYPDNKPNVWGTLCAKNIRHHKFPDHSTHTATNHFTQGGENIIVMGIAFSNITHPLDINGVPVTNVVGYEILRGSREGQKTIIAKGIFNNLREYTIPGTSQKSLFQNYPYNDLRPDRYLTSKDVLYEGSGKDDQSNPLTVYKKNIFSFHSPDTNFSRPFISGNELKIYQELTGTATGRFEEPYKHPKFKILTDGAYGLAASIGLIMAVQVVLGKGEGIRTVGTDKSPVSIGIAGGSSNSAGAAISGVAVKIIEVAADVFAVAVMTKVIGNEALKIVASLVRPRQYAIQYNSHGFYDGLYIEIHLFQVIEDVELAQLNI
jgi:hypothetical protein